MLTLRPRPDRVGVDAARRKLDHRRKGAGAACESARLAAYAEPLGTVVVGPPLDGRG